MTRLVVNSASNTERIRIIVVEGVRHGLDVDIDQFPKVLAGPEPFAATHLATGNMIKDARFKTAIPAGDSGNCFRDAVIKLLVASYCFAGLKKPAAADATLFLTEISSGTCTNEPVRL